MERNKKQEWTRLNKKPKFQDGVLNFNEGEQNND